ncbi:MAG: lycopene cyclase family protein [Rubrobacteraceae bacterium]
MATPRYDVVFVGGGLAAVLLLRELRSALSGRVAIVDPSPPLEQPPVHWSYWSDGHTLYERFAIGTWRQARVADLAPEPIAPFVLRLVRSTDVFEAELLRSGPAEWLKTTARSVTRWADDLYEISTDTGTIYAHWVFDSACEIDPVFPSKEQPQAVLSGTGIRVRADRPVFDAKTATLLDPLDECSFAYLLPLSSEEALLESATFDSVARDTDRTPLLGYLRALHPEASFDVSHEESGTIPLGFPPSQTSGPQHILIGTKRGLVKPSAGYGIVRIAEESQYLARLWREGRPLPPSRRASWQWRLLDRGFLRLAAQNSRLPLALVHRVMRSVPLAGSLRFIDEEISPRHLMAVVRSALPIVLGKR